MHIGKNNGHIYFSFIVYVLHVLMKCHFTCVPCVNHNYHVSCVNGVYLKQKILVLVWIYIIVFIQDLGDCFRATDLNCWKLINNKTTSCEICRNILRTLFLIKLDVIGVILFVWMPEQYVISHIDNMTWIINRTSSVEHANQT